MENSPLNLPTILQPNSLIRQPQTDVRWKKLWKLKCPLLCCFAHIEETSASFPISSFCDLGFAVYVQILFVSYVVWAWEVHGQENHLIQFINKARPWITLMAVGWEYGANMLTKYLAEAGENTPLIAAMCIDNPFDLEEATRSSPYQMAIDQKLTGGLIDILRSNKLLSRNYFKAKQKGFDMEKALAKSIHDFEKAIYIYGILAQETWLGM